MLKTIGSENIWIRLCSMWIVGLVILLLAWVFSFKALPEAVVRGSSGAFYVPVKAEDPTATFLRVFLWNLCVGCIPVTIGNIVRVKGVPLGYVLAFYHWGTYGILLGTNSFVIPSLGRFLPSLTTLFHGSGIYEISSYTLISAATFNLYGLHSESAGDWAKVRKRKKSLLKLSKTELALIGLAVLILAVSNYYEAWYIFHI